MAGYRRQHWVPRSYLRRWSPDGRRIHSYDRITREAKFVSVNDVAQRTRFYERFMSAGDAGTASEVGVLEREYQRWDDALRDATAVAERVAAGEGGSLEERQIMAIAVAVQMVRTPTFRAGVVDAVTEDLTRDFMEYLHEANPSLAASMDGNYKLTFGDDDVPSFVHAVAVWESDVVTRIAATLYHYLWVIGSNTSGIPFYTSDDPVALIMHDATPAERAVARTGVLPSAASELLDPQTPRALEIVFPLSPTLTLLMYQPDCFARLRPRQGQVLRMGPTTVRRLNDAQAGRCDRQVYSADGAFSDAMRALERRDD